MIMLPRTRSARVGIYTWVADTAKPPIEQTSSHLFNRTTQTYRLASVVNRSISTTTVFCLPEMTQMTQKTQKTQKTGISLTTHTISIEIFVVADFIHARFIQYLYR